MKAQPFPNPAAALRTLTVRHVQAVFNDRTKGETPIIRSDNALFDRHTPIWTVHGDVTTMMIGGVAALLMQMLHPSALGGVWDFSNFREDMLGRLRRTARFIAVTTYSDKAEALALIDRVKAIHKKVHGALPDGTSYSASDPSLLAWVHACETRCFLDAWQLYGNAPLGIVEQDTYVAQSALTASLLGADSTPRTIAELDALLQTFRNALSVDSRTREMARLVVTQNAIDPASVPIQIALITAAIDLLPNWARDMHDFGQNGFEVSIARGLSRLVAQTLRWAFAGRLGEVEQAVRPLSA